MIHVELIHPDLALKHWGEIYPLLDLAVAESNGEISEDSLKEAINLGHALVVAVYDDLELLAAIALEVITFSTGKKVLNIQLAGGTGMDLWYHQVDECCRLIAKSRDCQEIYIVGRKGWQRQLKQIGYQPIHTILKKEVM